MPWHIDKRGDEFCVIKDDDDENEGCHDTREKAERQMAALYASESPERTEADELDGPVAPLYRQAAPAGLIYRAEDGAGIIEGPVVPFNVWTEVNSAVEGHFMERFLPGSLAKTFQERIRRMRGWFDHGLSRTFERMPVMDIREAWEQDDAAHFRADLLPSVPDLIKDGLRRGIYGVSLGADVVNMQRSRRPGKSAHNPQGLEERTYTELRANEISLTPTPHYQTSLVFRSITDDLLFEKLMQRPEALLQLVRARSEPPHSGPSTEEVPQVEEGSRDTQPETAKPLTPSRDWLAPTEETKGWLP